MLNISKNRSILKVIIDMCRTQQCTTTITVTIITSNTYLRSSIVKVFVGRPTLRASMAQGLFFRWDRAQGRSPHAPGVPKNAYGPVGIPLIRGASGAGR